MKTQIASGAKTFTVILPQYSKTYLPDILDLKDKTIKYIDCLNQLIPYDYKGNELSVDVDDCYLSLMQKGSTNLFMKGVKVSRFKPLLRYGERENILKKIDLINSFIENNSNETKTVSFVFWYDEPEIMNPYFENQKNNIDYIEVKQFDPLTNRMYFSENRTLLDKEIVSFCFPFAIESDSYKTPSNKQVCSTDVYIKSFVTLQKNNFMFVENIPLCLFTTDYFVNRIILQNVKFDFQNSYISVVPGTEIDGVYFANVEYKS